LKFCARFRKSLISVLLLILTFTWVGCENLRYYNQAINGQYQIVANRRPIPTLIADKDTPRELKAKLRLVMELREFADKELKLPVKRQYLQYSDLHRRFVVWNVSAAQEFSLEPISWRFPIVGKATYRGYFSEKEARAYGEKLQKQGFDVDVGGVEAYSTMGWFRDPVLNTFINNTDVDLAETLFHELAHQTAFAGGDTDFNEAFATAVAEEGLRRWMLSKKDAAAFREYEASLKRKTQFLKLVMNARRSLEHFYQEQTSTNTQLASLAITSVPISDKRERKEAIINQLRADYLNLHKSWDGSHDYENWFKRPINNAKLNSVATYYELVPAFNQMLEECHGDLPSLYARARKLVKMKRSERDALVGRLARRPGSVEAEIGTAQLPPLERTTKPTGGSS